MARCIADIALLYIRILASPGLDHEPLPAHFDEFILFTHCITVIHNTSMSDYTHKGSLTSASYDHAEQTSTDTIMEEKRRTSVVGQPAHQEHGPLVDHKIPQDDVVQAQPGKKKMTGVNFHSFSIYLIFLPGTLSFLVLFIIGVEAKTDIQIWHGVGFAIPSASRFPSSLVSLS